MEEKESASTSPQNDEDDYELPENDADFELFDDAAVSFLGVTVPPSIRSAVQ